MRMNPAECDQASLLREFQNQLLLVHGARIARRMLLGDQQRRHNKLPLLVLPKQKPARFPVATRVHSGDAEEPR